MLIHLLLLPIHLAGVALYGHNLFALFSFCHRLPPDREIARHDCRSVAEAPLRGSPRMLDATG